MCLKNITEEELLKEVSKRVDEGKMKWKITYFCDTDKTVMELRSEEQKFILSFTMDTKIERNYTVHRIYKSLEPALLKMWGEKNKEKEYKQKEKENKIMEKLSANLKKL